MGTIKNVLLDCLQKTSAKGIPRIVKHQTKVLRTLWIIGVFLLCGLAGATLWSLLEEYLEFTTTTTTREERFSRSDVAVPELVVCNMQPLSKAGFNNTDGMITFNEYLEMIEHDHSLDRIHNRDLSSYKGYFKYIGTENATKIGHQLATYIPECRLLYATSASTIKSRKCSMGNIQLVSIPEFFNCYKVPFRGFNEEEARPFGISFILYLNTPSSAIDRHFDIDSETLQLEGVRMSVMMPGGFPDLRYTSFDAWPGESTQVGLRINKRVRLKKPYGNCIDFGERSYVDLQNNTLGYSQDACINSHIQENIATKCKCIKPELLVVSSSNLLKLPFCEAYTEDVEQLISRSKCLLKVHSGTSWEDTRKKCLPQCTEYRYSVSMTTARWPKYSQLLSFYQQYIAPHKEMYPEEFGKYAQILQLLQSGNVSGAGDLLSDFYEIEYHFARINVILNSAYIQVLEDIPQKSIDVLLSQIGGALNLYTGISFVVVIEVLEVIFKLVGQVYSGKRPTEETKNTTADLTVGSEDRQTMGNMSTVHL